MQEDQNYLINQAKIQNIVKPTWKNSSRNETSDVLKDKYFSQLEPEQVSLLLNMFKLIIFFNLFQGRTLATSVVKSLC